MTLVDNLIWLKETIREYESQYQRPVGSVKLLGASKAQPAHAIRTLYEAGLQRFGENYLQEALQKMEALADLPIEWHFIGRIQRNKIKKIAAHFDWVQSVADTDTALRLSAARLIPNPLNICIEVNISHEESKAGVAISQVLSLAETCLHLPNIKLRGLMAIPARNVNFDQNVQAFRKLHVIWNVLKDHGIELDTLSMGMSEDFVAAIAEGSTLIRVGTKLFGQRPAKPPLPES